MTAEPVIRVKGLRKSYDGFEAVRGIDLEVGAGEIFAFLGPNGAGKTTTVEILEGYRTRNDGVVSVLGVDPQRADRDWRQRVGFVLQESRLVPELTPHETVEQYAGYYAAPRDVDDTVALVGLTDKADVRTSKLSGGQQRRLDVALALIGDPELLFLDEPTTGFDPAARRQAWELVRELCSEGTTVLLTTHYLDEAEHLADRVGVLAGGRLVAEGTPSELIGGSGATVVRFDVPAAAADLDRVLPAGAVRQGDRIEFTTTTPTAAVHAVTGWAVERGIELDSLVVTRPSLEDVFLQLAGEEPRP